MYCASEALLARLAPRLRPITRPGVAVRNGRRFDRKTRVQGSQRSPPIKSETINGDQIRVPTATAIVVTAMKTSA